MDETGIPLPLGASGRLEAVPMTNAAGDHALLVRQGDTSRALLTGERGDERERVVVIPLDEEVEMRMDGDALAVWLTRGSMARVPSDVPRWASAIGLLLVLVLFGFAVLGSLTFFGWVVDLVT
jgi:hypothetical protein